MADVNTGDGGGGGKHQKKRAKKSNPRIDMTPMVDLAFLLLTFFVLTSQLNKAKTLEMTMPKDVKDTTNKMKLADELAVTLLVDGNKDGMVYYYSGVLKETTTLNEGYLDKSKPKSMRKFFLESNKNVIDKMKKLRQDFKDGKITEDTLKARAASKAYQGADDAKFYIVKWGGDATYGDVINIIDELKISDVSKYALTKISRVELEALSGKTGRKYPELLEPAPAAAGGPQ